jgi:phosphate starvation-inducible protein PhoH and related proteins
LSDTPKAPNRVLVTFDDNRLLLDLFGQADENITLVEMRLEVRAHASGNYVAITGEPIACQRAKRVLESLYARLRKGQKIGTHEVEAEIKMAIEEPRLFEDLPNDRAPRTDFASVGTRRKMVIARTRAQDTYLRQLQTRTITFATGPAGTGKTYMAVAHAAGMLERGEATKLVFSRPAVEAGERLGFLPGSMQEKVDPYLRPLMDALRDFLPGERIERAMEGKVIEIAPLAFMRGRTLANAVVILDEAQNTTSMQMKMFLTRLGEGSRMIVTGDPSQIDLPPGQTSGLIEALRIIKGIDDIATIEFKGSDVVRHELVMKIVQAYEADRKPPAPGARDT